MTGPQRSELADRLLGLLGLGLRSGGVIVGVDGTRALLQRGRARVVVMASDASPRARDRIESLARGRGVPLVEGPVSVEIGNRLGRPPVMVVGVEDRGIGSGVISLMAGREGR